MKIIKFIAFVGVLFLTFASALNHYEWWGLYVAVGSFSSVYIANT